METKRGVCAVLAAAGVSALAAGAPPVFPAKRVEKPPVIDGVLSPGEWDGLSYATDFIDVVTGKPVQEQTEVWWGYDDQAIYIGARLRDSKPSAIVAKQTQPGAPLESDDTFTFSIDPFNTRQWDGVSTFTVNARGTQHDKFAEGRSSKKEWRGEWDAQAKIGPDGWVVEIRIPWKILRLPPKGARDIPINMVRHQQRLHLSSWLANMGQDYRWERAAVWKGVEVPAVSGDRLHFQAYLSPEWLRGKARLDAGLDARYAASSQYTLLGTLNPDFVNVEQQVAGIEFTRSERILEDNRPFFSEGSDYFWLTGSYTFARMFYSRRIGDFDYGAKGFGKLDPNNDLSWLVAQTGSERTDAVFHFVHRFNPRSSASLYSTLVDAPGYDNKAYGASLNLGHGHWGSQFQYAQVHDNGQMRDTGAVAASYSGPKLFSVVRHIWIDPGFNPGLGYVAFDDKRGFESYSVYNEDLRTGPLRSREASLWLQKYDKYDGSNRVTTAQIDLSATTRNGTVLGLGYQHEKFEEELDRIFSAHLGLNTDDKHRNASVYASTGTRGGRSANYLSAGGKYRVARALDVGLSYAVLDYLDTAEQTVLTLGWEIDAKRSVTARAVWNGGNTNAYFAYRSAGFTGLEFYLIVGDPNAPKWTERVAAKLMWAW